MEKAVSSSSSEQQRAHRCDGGKTVLMTLEPNKEDFSALGCPQGEQRIAAFVKDAKMPLESAALSGTSVEGGTDLKEAAFYASDNVASMNIDGRGNSGADDMCSRKKDPTFFLPLARQEPDVGLEAHNVADEPDPALCDAVPSTPHRKELCTRNEEHVELKKGFYRADSRGSAELRSMTVSGSTSWDCSTLETRRGDLREESTLERLSGLKDSAGSTEVQCVNPSRSMESTFTVESKIVNTVQMDTDQLESDSQDLNTHKATAETSIPCAGVRSVSGEEKYHKNEPKQLEAFSKEHLDKKKKGIQRFDWISGHSKSSSPHYKDINKPTDGATNLSIRGQAVHEVPRLLPLPVFRKTLNPVLNKSKSLESVSSDRTGLAMEASLSDLSSLNAAEWTLQKPSLQINEDLAISKQSWTVNAEDSVERIPLMSLEPTPCSSYDIEMRPYVCSVLLEEQGKEELGQEEDPTVYTCIECSIYFKKKEHLMDHMLQHNQGPGQDQDRDAVGGQCQFSCNECGWAFGDPGALEQHKRLHQESREKIIEEIQKLNEFSDEGREARLQCPKCVFGTNSSKIFVQHAKMHVKERKDQGMKNVNLFGSTGSGEMHDSPVHNIYKHLKPNKHTPVQVQPHSSSKGLSTCMLCSFPAPNENILKEHMKYAHSHLPWDIEIFEEDSNQPGTSRDAYSPARPGRFSEMDYFGKAERLFPQPHRESTSHYESVHSFSMGHQRLNKSNGTNKKDFQTSEFHTRKAAPYGALHKNLGLSTLTSAKVYSQFALQQMKKKSTIHHLESDGDNVRSHPEGLEELRHKWALANDVGSMEEEISVTTEIDLTENRSFKPFAIPQSVLALKRTFGDTLKATDSSIASEEQQHQLQKMVPVVLLEEMNLHPQKTKQPKGKLYKKKIAAPSREFMMDESLPLDILLLDSPLEGSLELDDLLDTDSPMLKNEERKCPYCPDRFHNGIGLANHVRGHLNRVGVSYNVRHFISAEEVKAIEQKFSFQKKKKKVANFDPSTFSLMRCEFCGAGFDTRAGLSSHARAHLRDFGITNWELTISPINILKELLANSSQHPMLQSAVGTEPSSPNREREVHGFGHRKSMTPMSECSIPRSPLSPFPPAWGDESMQSFRDVMASEEEEMVAMEVGSPPIPKKSTPAGQLDQTPNRIGTKLSPEAPGNKPDSQDSKTQNLTTCEVCGACFETRKGLSSHARSHLRQLGVAESESSGAPIDLLYELMKQKGKPDSSPMSPTLSKKSSSPKEGTGSSPRPTLLSLSKTGDRLPDPPVNKAIKSPPGFSSKSLSQPGSPLLKKVPPTLSGSPPPKHPEDKTPKLPLSPLQSSPKAQWPQTEEEGPLNLTVDSDSGKEIDCQLCGAWFETRKGLSSHARAHLRHLGVNDPDAKGSPIDVLNDLIQSEDFKSRLSSLLPSERKSLVEAGSLDRPSPKSTAAVPATGMKQPPPPRPLGKQPAILSPHSLPPSKKLKPQTHRLSAEANLQRKQGLSSSAYWASDAGMSPLNLSSGSEPVRDIRCEFCGEYFENRKGLSSHARSHLRQMGVTEWYVNGSPIDTLREILKRRAQPRGGTTNPPAPGQKAMTKTVIGSMGSLEPHSPGEIHVPSMPKKVQQPGSPMGHSPTSSPPPTARKMFPGMGPPSFQKKLKQDQMRMEIKREMMSGSLHGEPHPSNRTWSPREEMSPLNLSSRADPVRDIRCEFCGEYFENRKGLSSHARSHLRQMGVTEWSVNGSPIDTLREILKKKSKPCMIKKEPHTSSIEPPKPMAEEGAALKSPGKMLQAMSLSPLGGRTGKPSPSGSSMSREISLSPLTSKSHGGFLTPLSTKRPLQEERLGGHGEVRQKTYIQTELPFKAKAAHDKPAHTSSEACCELCGLYFENRKALASHARAHLRQFGVTEWCVNGSPIETLSEWIKHRPQKAGAYRSYIQGGRPFTKKFRNSSHSREQDSTGKRLSLGLQPGAMPFMSKSLVGEMGHSEPSKLLDRGSGGGGERPMVTSPLSLVKVEEHRQNINKFERRQAKPPEAPLSREEAASDFQQKMEEARQPPPRMRPVPSLVPRPPQTSLVKFVGNIYTLKCRFCEVEFQGPLSIQEEWVRHLQRHILEMNFSKADPLRSEPEAPEVQAITEAQ
ncbi:protein Wiz isoform X2 [Trachemys scripta elegans]|uniref:protein Wiz isoform X2 n=1 Tax=Trachemys scripta elegans TaxID=31138 RepID=UPI001553FF88|nr:protein Wiz isoform X2 [Trachemys scripta elegans]